MIPKPPESRLVLVLDTNVCLDLFVFHDPRWASLLAGLQNGTLTAITKNSCRDEWLTVLHYKQLPITDETRPAISAAFDQLIRCTNPDLSSTIKLPICSDPDDQQFMELARDAHATHLITKDKALLKCAKKVAQLGLFQILSPEKFLGSVEF
ncbi:PIN domain-containing protein [Solimicrobium silvestre]|uniref:Putative nucleic acid-binding protein contains PIN domain n=1 Tax=Solimicrobium silvestre TaxID=2099400 RepID=A0A2S9GUB7_9BURK|nr:PIN domain-containing protein [Solimicrobium silvestre]PRC91309.1 putative nucleic acid-binding protein contains PIN domain [Solimicrobium silvestre]